jgi:hypothetical protein
MNPFGELSMRRPALIAACALLMPTVPAPGDEARPGESRPRNKVEGTWEHSFKDQPELRQVKVINQDHFICVTYVRDTLIPVTTAGGS